MISKKRLFVGLLLIIICGLWLPSASLAQAPTNVIVVYPAAEPQEDSMALSVFFTIVDESGRPISRPGIETVSIQLLGGNSLPTPATFSDPNTPFYITLLLDASGSMQNVMGSVREAAQEAINNTPPNARVAVIKFNDLPIDDVIRPIQNFTSDMVLVKGAINAVDSEPGAPTCLYNVAYKSIELLDETTQNPQERQAIILFTDGKDERADGSPCSQWKYEDVINRATRALPITPIHTIGLCSDATCANLKREELRSMAKETSAFSATGDQNSLGQLFGEIMEGLNSQFVARANVYARQGENQAVLSVKLRDREAPLTTTFNFFSDKDYDVPPPPVAAQFTSLIYDSNQDVYTVGVSVANPENVQKIVVEVWDEKSGTQVPPAQEFDNPEASLQFERPTEGLSAGREYSFRVKAVDEEGFMVADEEGETTLDLAEFVYEPPAADEIQFVIKSVQANFNNNQLLIDMDIPEASQVNSYEGFIVDEDTGAGVFEFTPTLFDGAQIQVDLPPAIAQIEETREYRATIFLSTKDGRRLQAEPYQFKAVPPPPPGLLLRIWQVVQIPIVLAVILIIILSTIGLIIYWNRPARKESLPSPMPRPPIDRTVITASPVVPSQGRSQPAPNRQAHTAPKPPSPPVSPKPAARAGSAGSAQPRLRLEITKSPSPSGESKKIITRFPCVIGREGGGGDFNVPDPHMSRRHAEISVRGGQFFVTDLGSRNGTFINETKLAPNTPTPLTGSAVIGLGRRSKIKVDPR